MRTDQWWAAAVRGVPDRPWSVALPHRHQCRERAKHSGKREDRRFGDVEHRIAEGAVDRDVQVFSYPVRGDRVWRRGIAGMLHGVHPRPYDTTQYPQRQNDKGCLAA